MKIQNVIQTLTQNVAPRKEQQSADAFPVDKKDKASAEVVRLFEKYGRTLDADSSKAIEQFFSRSEGTEASKLETLDIVLSKGMPVDEAHLIPIHQAILHDTASLQTMMESEVEINTLPSETIAYMKLPQSVKEALQALVDKGVLLTDAIPRLVKALTGKSVTDMAKGLSLLQKLDITPLMLEQLEKVALSESGLTEDAALNIPFKVISSLSSSTAQVLTDQGEQTENKAVFNMPKVVDPRVPVEETHREEVPLKAPAPVTVEPNKNTDEMEMDVANALEHILSTIEIMAANVTERVDVKLYLVKETTEATLAAKKTFEDFQKTTHKTLEKLPEMSKPQLQEAVTKVIDGLEKVILKSNVTLFTDMAMERDLLKSSALLEKARVLLDQGQLQEAKKIVQDVKSTVIKIIFEPSIQRIQGFATHKAHQLSNALDSHKTMPLEFSTKQALAFLKGPDGVRQGKDVFEILRFMGLNHEAEVAELMEGKPLSKNQDVLQGNAKELLLKMMKEEMAHKTVDSKEQSTLNLSGQQMMSQPDQGDKRRFHCYNVPIEEGDALGNMKVIVRGRSQHGKMDPNNTELYFGLELKAYGAVGIKLSIQNGVVDALVSTSNPSAHAVIAPVFDAVMENLDDLGFQKGKLTVSGVSDPKPSEKQLVKKPLSEKGFDFKI